jgi:hypothetical protein
MASATGDVLVSAVAPVGPPSMGSVDPPSPPMAPVQYILDMSEMVPYLNARGKLCFVHVSQAHQLFIDADGVYHRIY